MSIDLTEQNYAETIASTDGQTVVQFTAPWCGPCRMLTPRLQELEDEGKITYYKVNVDENSELARNFTIMSVPTLIFYVQGTLRQIEVGAKSKKELEAILESL